ncbi:helix-turn-helix domain-containing protein [Defluviimonas sp. SAOS-178_SWC]|uniref:helix-turn-helix domain-containing protein n=1 Tax=Defluviimonas sp. SAOS-178_SWC TaxID=3121287 RepID=UPI0032217011
MTEDNAAVAEKNWYSEETATFGDRLAGAREAMGLSQKDLAQRLGVRTKVIQGWEEDLKEPRANRLQMLAGMLNVSLMWLLTGEGDGIEAPDARSAMSAESAALLPEIRQIRTEMGDLADRLGRLESRLRLALTSEAA